jgi:mycothiol maleylpyruvate isomerase-like protein
MHREELLKREDEAWLEFVDVVAAVPPDRRGVEGVVPGWSVHDLVWHVAFWAGWAGEVLERIRRGEPDPGDPDENEAEILRAGRGIGWDDVVRRAEQSRERARAALSSFGDLPRSAEEWFTDDTFDHYQEHAAQIRTFSA